MSGLVLTVPPGGSDGSGQGPEGPQGPKGDPGPTMAYFRYRLASGTAANDPGVGKLKFDAAPQQDATKLYVDWMTSDGFDAHLLFLLTAQSTKIVLQDLDMAEHYQVWRQTGPGVNYPDWFEVPVEFVEAFPSGFEFADNQAIAALLLSDTPALEARVAALERKVGLG